MGALRNRCGKRGVGDRRWWGIIRHKEESVFDVIKEWASLLVIVAIPYLEVLS